MTKTDQTISINFVGDIMMGDSYHMNGIGVGSRLARDAGLDLFKKAGPLLRDADLNFGNLECTFPETDRVPGKDLITHQAYSARHAEQLGAAGFNILNMANNHTMQYGSSIFNHSMQLLEQQGIHAIGTLESPCRTVEMNGTKIVFLAYSLRPNETPYEDVQYIEGKKETIISDIHYFVTQSDHIIVSLHWGDEYVNYPSDDQVALAHDIIDAGASMIIGHHSHILQGIEYYKKGVIVYSLGNFLFDKPQKLQRMSIILNARFSKEEIRHVTYEPVFINSDFQPEPAKGNLKTSIELLMKGLSEDAVSEERTKRDYNKDVAKGLRDMRKQFYIYFIMNMYRFPAALLFILIKKALVRRFIN